MCLRARGARGAFAVGVERESGRRDMDTGGGRGAAGARRQARFEHSAARLRIWGWAGLGGVYLRAKLLSNVMLQIRAFIHTHTSHTPDAERYGTWQRPRESPIRRSVGSPWGRPPQPRTLGGQNTQSVTPSLPS